MVVDPGKQGADKIRWNTNYTYLIFNIFLKLVFPI